MSKAVLIAGGNIGDLEKRLPIAVKFITARTGIVLATSDIFRSKSWGFEGDDFHNQVIVLETTRTPEQLLGSLQAIERDFGRDVKAERREKRLTKQKYVSRTMDIDILFYDDIVMNTRELKIPHPKMAKRMFVLEPAMQVIPDMVHPVTGLTIRQMYEKLKAKEQKQ